LVVWWLVGLNLTPLVFRLQWKTRREILRSQTARRQPGQPPKEAAHQNGDKSLGASGNCMFEAMSVSKIPQPPKRLAAPNHAPAAWTAAARRRFSVAAQVGQIGRGRLNSKTSQNSPASLEPEP
jgi:hypothetical protein